MHRPAPPGGSSKRWAMQQAVLTTVLPAAQCFSAAVGAARCRRDLPWTPLARASRRRHLKRRYLESTRLAVPPGGVYHPTACGRFTGGRSRTPLAIPQSCTHRVKRLEAPRTATETARKGQETDRYCGPALALFRSLPQLTVSHFVRCPDAQQQSWLRERRSRR